MDFNVNIEVYSFAGDARLGTVLGRPNNKNRTQMRAMPIVSQIGAPPVYLTGGC